MNPKISVVTVVYNAVETLEQTMLSVLNQTYDNIEYIIIDGGSTDGSVDIIKKYADRLAYWVSEPDKGIYDAMNKGIWKATGDWINFMNAGDQFCNPDVLNILHLELVKDDISVVYGDSISIYGKDSFYFPARDLKTLRYSGMAFCHQAVLVRRPILLLYPFDLSFKLLADYNLFHTLLLERIQFKYVSFPICVYSAEGGITDSHQWQCQLEANRVLHKKDMFYSRLYFVLKNFMRRFMRPYNQFLRRCKYRKNLICENKRSKYIY